MSASSSNIEPSNNALPDDIVNVISEHLGAGSIINYSHTCKRYHAFFNNPENNFVEYARALLKKTSMAYETRDAVTATCTG